jgi:hypothetical protein
MKEKPGDKRSRWITFIPNHGGFEQIAQHFARVVIDRWGLPTGFMKLFFAVLFAVLAAGFISFMTLSLYKAMQLHKLPVQKSQGASVQPTH